MYRLDDKKRILLDLNVQRDLFHPTGSLYTKAAGAAYKRILRLFGWADLNGVPVLSTVLLNRFGRRGAFSAIPHCIEGCEGELKMPGTFLADMVNLGGSHTADLPEDILNSTGQILFETRDPDPFRHQKFERLISELGESYNFVVCGATLAKGIRQAVLGLRSRGHKVSIATDAVVKLQDASAEMNWLKLQAKDVELVDTAKQTRRGCLQHQRRRQAAAS